MAAVNQPICFQCGQPSRSDRFNLTSDGRVCGACRDRLLATLPAPLPGGGPVPEPEFVPENEPEPEYEPDGDVPA